MSPLLHTIGEWVEELNLPVPFEAYRSLKGAAALPVDLLSKRDINFVNRSPDEFQLEYRLSKLFTKWEDKVAGTAPDRTGDAIKGWLEDNHRLVAFNQRLMSSSETLFHEHHERVKQEFTQLCKGFKLETVAKYFRHGPGRTSTRAGVKATKVAKFGGPFSISTRMYNYLIRELREEDDWWLYHTVRSDQVEIKDALVLDTVPKTALVDRVVTYEADLDIYVQLGLHGWLVTQVLPRIGIYIDANSLPRTPVGPTGASGSPVTVTKHGTTAELHKKWTYDEQLATLDATSGSNNWSELYVAYISSDIPDLSRFLSAMSQQWVYIPHADKTVRKHIWAGMGHGGAFALETLLFHLTEVASTDGVAVLSTYGDDMMCSVEHAPQIVETYVKYTPVRLNAEKSHYLQGDRFRESCGEETYSGFSVWPLRIRKDPTVRFRFTKKQLAVLSNQPKTFKCLGRVLYGLQKGPDRLTNYQLEAIYDFYTIINGIDRMSVWTGTHDSLWEDLSRRLLQCLPYCLRFLHSPSGNGGRQRRNRFTILKTYCLEGRQGYCINMRTREDLFSHKEDGSFVLSIQTKRGRKTVDVEPDTLLAYALSGERSRSATRLSSKHFRIGLSE